MKAALSLVVLVAAGIAGGVYFVLEVVPDADPRWPFAAAGSVLLIPAGLWLASPAGSVRTMRAAQLFFLPLLYPFSFATERDTWTLLAVLVAIGIVQRVRAAWTAPAAAIALAIAYVKGMPYVETIHFANVWALAIVGWVAFLPIVVRERKEAWALIRRPLVAASALTGFIAFVATMQAPIYLRVPLYAPVLWFGLWVALNARTATLAVVAVMALACATLQLAFDLRVGVPFYALLVVLRAPRPLRQEAAFLAFEAALGVALLFGIAHID
jgi:hypothetical protein